MNKLRNNETGSGAVTLMFILILLVVIGGAGYYFYTSNFKTATAPASNSTNSTSSPKTTTPKKTDVYAGWKYYCDTSIGGCFKYPSEWGKTSSLDTKGVKAFVQNKAATINVVYSEPASGKSGLGDYTTHSLSALTSAGSLFTAVGGYYNAGNIPGYDLVDTSLIHDYNLAAGKISPISSDNGLFFTKAENKATLTASYNNTTGNPITSSAQANDWFNSADGKVALLIVQSYYNK